MKKYLWSIAEFIIGILPGFFLVFNFMFTDIISVNERAFSFLVVAVTYLILGAAFGLAGADIKSEGIWLALPAILFAVLYSFSEVATIVMNLLYTSAVLVFSITGFSLGAKLSKNRNR